MTSGEEHDATEHDNVTPIDLLSGDNYTSAKIRGERYEACLGCERLFKPTRTCKECGCFMALKTWLQSASCPLGKWDVTDVPFKGNA